MINTLLTIAFRVDASIDIGTGHVMRCLTLANSLRIKGHQCVFICANHSGHLGDLIENSKFEIHLINRSEQPDRDFADNSRLVHAEWLGTSWKDDAEQTTKVLSNIRPDWLVVDHYAIDAGWEKRVANNFVSKIMVIDDLADRQHICHLLLDQNLGRRQEDYKGLVPETCICLIGPRYALLRPEFAELRDQSLEFRSKPELRRILISLGGVDRNNITGEVLDALLLAQLRGNTELDIIMGSSAPHLEAIREQADRLPFFTSVSVNVTDMAERMCWADLAIGAAGGTAWERCCLGLPSILIVLAENQSSGTAALEAHGAAVVIKNSEKISSVLPKLIAKMRNPEKLRQITGAAAAITGGIGVEKVIEYMERIK